MQIERLPFGERADDAADCIHIEEADGGFLLTGSGLSFEREGGGEDSVAIISGQPYPSAEAAENAGLAWAGSLGVERLSISRA